MVKWHVANKFIDNNIIIIIIIITLLRVLMSSSSSFSLVSLHSVWVEFKYPPVPVLLR